MIVFIILMGGIFLGLILPFVYVYIDNHSCKHMWETIDKLQTFDYSDTCRETQYHLRCKLCGDVKTKTLRND